MPGWRRPTLGRIGQIQAGFRPCVGRGRSTAAKLGQARQVSTSHRLPRRNMFAQGCGRKACGRKTGDLNLSSNSGVRVFPGDPRLREISDFSGSKKAMARQVSERPKGPMLNICARTPIFSRKDAGPARARAQRRTHYPPCERLIALSFGGVRNPPGRSRTVGLRPGALAPASVLKCHVATAATESGRSAIRVSTASSQHGEARPMMARNCRRLGAHLDAARLQLGRHGPPPCNGHACNCVA